MGCVYCYQVASFDCFKIGRTKNSARERLKNVSVGSPHRLSIYREIQTDHPSLLEKQIHWRLNGNRAENGEFFNVTKPQLDKTIEEAQAHITKSQPIIQQAEKLKHQKPKPQILDATDGVRSLHQELKEAICQSVLLQQRIDLLQSQLQIEIGDNAGIEGVAFWKWRECWRLNLALFKRERPKLFEKYKRLSASRFFRLL
jgi:hypothetical protein